MQNQELNHFGIPGMKWGKRMHQQYKTNAEKKQKIKVANIKKGLKTVQKKKQEYDLYKFQKTWEGGERLSRIVLEKIGKDSTKNFKNQARIELGKDMAKDLLGGTIIALGAYTAWRQILGPLVRGY